MSILRRLWGAVFGEHDQPPPEPRTDAERLAVAVLRGDEEAALALADLVLMTYHRLAQLPADVSFDTVPWPRRARVAFARLGIQTFRQLLGTNAAELLRQPDFGEVSLRQVRELLGAYGLALRGEQPARPG